MPWIPELFTAQAAQHVVERARIERRAAVPYFEGLLTGDTDALIGSFAGEPELHHPVRGRVKGVAAFSDFVAAQRAWLTHRGAEAEHVAVLITPTRTVEEVVLRLDGGRIAVPIAIAVDRSPTDAFTNCGCTRAPGR